MIPLTGWSQWQHNASPFSSEVTSQSAFRADTNLVSWHVVVPFSYPKVLFMVLDELMTEVLGKATAVTFLYYCQPQKPDAKIYGHLKGIHAVGQTYAALIHVRRCKKGGLEEVLRLGKTRPIDQILIDEAHSILSEMDLSFCKTLADKGLPVQSLRS
ncbi:MAG: hypothetical protein GY943_23690 [Chloroflexi bacterium]|nr:hypothetical protein [Chloroflexota bacterium]